MTFVVSVLPPPLPVMVIVCFPTAALEPTVTVMVDVPEPGAAMELGLKLTLRAVPSPEADKLIAESKPPEITEVIVEVPELPFATLKEVGLALMVNLGGALVTFRKTVRVSMVLPEVPVTVRAYNPVTVDEATVIVMVEVPAPVIEVGLKPTVTPEGWPVAAKEMPEVKPPVTVLVRMEVADLPCTTESSAGAAERLKPEVDALSASVLIRPDPFGLPQPDAKS